MDVRIDREAGLAEGEEHYAGRRLRADSRQGSEPFSCLRVRQGPEKLQVKAPATRVNLAEDRLQSRRLRRREAAGPDRVLDVAYGCIEHRLPVRIALEEAREGAPGVGISGVLREQRQDQLA